MKKTVALVAALAIGGSAIQAHSMFLRSAAPQASIPGVNKPIPMKPVHELPRWAREPLADYLDAAYQIRAAIVDLNRDGHPEILLAAAPPAPDLHIPKRAFSVLIESDRGWVERQSDSECQPNRFGAFRHQGWWDIRCREGLTERVLRWNGGRYGRS